MNLKELLKKCTPAPLVVAVGKEFCFHDTTRVAIVEALERATGIIEDLQCPADYPAKDFRALLKKATTINIKQKGN